MQNYLKLIFILCVHDRVGVGVEQRERGVDVGAVARPVGAAVDAAQVSSVPGKAAISVALLNALPHPNKVYQVWRILFKFSSLSYNY